jgi:hypothetical protein
VASDQEKSALGEDLELFEEQRQDPFDDILLLVTIPLWASPNILS